MIWRGIIVIVMHFTVALLIWAGYSWLVEGHGLNPLIAFPGAFIIYAASMAWLSWEAERSDVAINDYLDWLEYNESLIERLADEADAQDYGSICTSLKNIRASLDWWENKAS